jgi:hypothetical protein
MKAETVKYRDRICFSFFFLTFFGGNLHRTKTFCNFVRVRQAKIKYIHTYISDGCEYFGGYFYKWKTIKIE